MENTGLFIARNIRALLAARGISQKELARRIEITEQGLSKIMGGREPRPGTLALIAEALGTTPYELRKDSSEGGPTVESLLEIIKRQEQDLSKLREPMLRELFDAVSGMEDKELKALIDYARAIRGRRSPQEIERDLVRLTQKKKVR